ncbi:MULTISPECIES: nucleoside-diphosphate sugar epimerase [unclassified Kitasatospora]|uniref:nucleoside-diphosphate sugar epimerase n=1 Tax=unclassified Kitasatospora TaxID=2633591 RepID=UPI00340E83BB
MTDKRVDDTSPVLVVGASGTVGRHVGLQLVAAGVRARTLTQRALLDPTSLEAAAQGVGAVLLGWPFPTTEGAAEAVGVLAREVGRVVFLSPAVPGRPDGTIETLLAGSGVRHTVLRAHGFATALQWSEEIRADGAVRGYGGTAGLNPVDERDIAAVAVRALVEDGHDGARYVLTGPDSPTQAEQVSIIGKAAGRPARWQEIPREAARHRMLCTGRPPAIADGALDFIHARITAPEPVTTTVQDLTGHPARSFHTWATDHAALFR